MVPEPGSQPAPPSRAFSFCKSSDIKLIRYVGKQTRCLRLKMSSTTSTIDRPSARRRSPSNVLLSECSRCKRLTSVRSCASFVLYTTSCICAVRVLSIHLRVVQVNVDVYRQLGEVRSEPLPGSSSFFQVSICYVCSNISVVLSALWVNASIWLLCAGASVRMPRAEYHSRMACSCQRCQPSGYEYAAVAASSGKSCTSTCCYQDCKH